MPGSGDEAMSKETLSIVIPTLNEAGVIGGQLARLQALRRRGVEVVVADGGSTDGTPELAAALVDAVVFAPRGRAAQMNAGAQRTRGNVLLFLHADTRLPERADELITTGLAAARKTWGRFDVQIEGTHPLLRLVAVLMNWRSRLTGIATGDQAIFVRRSTFERCDGFKAIPLMEDIALSRRLKWFGRPLCLRTRAITSGRRWQRDGVVRTILLMWQLRLGYFFGVDPVRLALRYDHGRSEP
jgi:rSAM/selenodomain-associated transferase 2